MATRANVEVVTVKRVGGMMAIAGMATTVVGTNADLNDPIGWAVRKLSGTVADITNVASSEVQAIADVDALLDLVELRTMESILTNYDKVDSEVGPRKESFDQLAKRLLTLIPQRRAQIEREHDIDLGELKVAGITVWRASDGVVHNS